MVAQSTASEINTFGSLTDDPYLGYGSIEDAVNDCIATSQVEAFLRMMNHENVFISGPAGSGKSYLLKPFLNFLRENFPQINVSLTAPTGIAAEKIDGQTFHSWAGVVEGKITNKFNLTLCDVLVIDEVSMLPAHLFVDLNKQLQKAKKNTEPFGGIQLIMLGDFMQLPPVPDRENPEHDCSFAITTAEWEDADIKMLYMDKVHRTSDPMLQKVLNNIVRRKDPEETLAILRSRMGEKMKDPHKKYVKLYTTNKRIEQYNKEKLAQINNAEIVYTPRFDPVVPSFNATKNAEEFMRKRNIVPVTLKVGATVIVTRNVSGASNGSIGEVVSLDYDRVMVKLNNGNTVPIFTFDLEYQQKFTKSYVEPETGKSKTYTTKEMMGYIRYMPLKLGFAISVHKSQGQTYDGVCVDLSNCFMPSLGYVALSRVRSLDDLVVEDISDDAIHVSQMSYNVTNFVKKESLKNRAQFMESIEDYEQVAENVFYRNALWSMILSSSVSRQDIE